MRSKTGLVASLVVLLALPIAIASQMLPGVDAEMVLHLAVGTGCVLLAVAAFDFGLPRWVAWLGCLSAASFGTIFLLQGVAQLLGNAALSTLAFDVLGQQIERFLPDLIIVWFIALAALGTQGKTRIFGWVTVAIAVVAEAVALAGAVLDIDVPTSKIVFLLPFVWLLLESAKPSPVDAHARATTPDTTAERLIA